MYHDPVPWVFSALSQPLRLHCWPGPGYKNVAMPCRKRRRSQKPWIRSQKTLSSWPYLLTLWWHLGSPVITLLEPLFFSLVKWYPQFPWGDTNEKWTGNVLESLNQGLESLKQGEDGVPLRATKPYLGREYGRSWLGLDGRNKSLNCRDKAGNLGQGQQA